MNWQLTGLAILFVAVMASALAVIHSKHQSRVLFMEWQREVNLRDELNVEWGQLQLEQSTWATHGRIEEAASQRLDMRLPDSRTTVILLE
ncbi:MULTISPECIES: cell division protein FtsL [Ectothiorhodospira]|uniref:Cell division protein FtsL n=1 Tax=Ectothiorhodospira marina TaxID=1396821 RepID=A0A1H7HBZ4_9GAMM|nr:cell division protein FtsL [Ectothiorhodospira marina]MCG5515085.1 cell division protein FtsL [Ectothiorhodospira sp. 9100]MCG5517803.1 cell division protein FtsL [Ectothiorhodospira sp. 9905]SEK46892.1 cell division protein FtsL [Ectothiorhodospira marina]